jgi:hypothetical protein
MLDASPPDSTLLDAAGGPGILQLVAVLHSVIFDSDTDPFAVEPALTVLLSS